ncbi:23S rRNA pseudouridine955/2504/2580 synthase [Nitrosospira briensis]|uniref:Pseudouridine synthase n=1 Tax=Nitrosospira briensis TaxID=35799 RepID=A0A1I4XQW8_9PROT|nr:23S rRNA pseudouridine955/2504/2580 synthase [Nitrosospira briensis]SFO01631.1 ribosomal large subunit pseudouridine synthase C [Nitrosospira briensis]
MASISRIKDLGKEFPLSSAVTEIIGEDSGGQRIDNFLIKRLKNVPKSHIYQLLRSGQVRLNSRRVRADHHLQPGDAVRIPPVRMTERNSSVGKRLARSQFIPFEVLFEDEALIVVNKPAGVAVHGGSGVSFGIIEQLRAQHPDWKFLELVHRLDRETSGVLLLAKRRAALVELHRQIRAGMMEKRYLTLVKGSWRNARQSVKLPLNKYVTFHGERRVAVITDDKGKKEGMAAHTIFTLRKSFRDFSLLEAELKTGRTHQIRVHLAHLGYPIAGDDKYGDFALNKELAKRTRGPRLERMFLHAFQAGIIHPATLEKLSVEAPLTEDLAGFMSGLDDTDKPLHP